MSTSSQPTMPSSAHDDAEKGLADVVLDHPTAPVSPRLSGTSTTVPSPADGSPKPSRTSSAKTLATPADAAIPPKVETSALVPAAKPLAPPTSSPPKAPKPKDNYPRHLAFLLWFNTYRKFFTVVVIFNLVCLVVTAAGDFNYAKRHLSAWILGNLLCAVLMRNELFGRFLYLFVNTCFAKWTPLWFRLSCTATLQHLGGIHSGCAVSGVAWLIYKVVIIFVHHDVTHESILALGVVTNVCVIVSILSAFPWVRNTHHNTFERYHRFVGWTGLACTWIFVLVDDFWSRESETWTTSGTYLVGTQEFWFVIGMTVFIVLPWTFTRRVEVEVEIPSPKVAVLKFKRGMQQGLLARISRTCALEYHAFGTISEGTKAPSNCHYLICGVQGDFTRGLVENPPTHIWTRELKFAGVGNTSVLYKRGIRLCTGTGIGAALSTCIQSPNWYLIWIGSDQEKTFGPTIAGLIYKNIEPERRTLWDSKKEGKRPDMMKLVREAHKSFGAEVVFITSNWGGNEELMRGCRLEGIHAFGTLWDF